MLINNYTVELRGAGASSVWCVYTKRSSRNAGSNLVLQIDTSRQGVPTVLSHGQQVRKLTAIIQEVLP